MTEYNFSMNIGDRKVKFRKWKVKDKNKLINNADNKIAVREALVYDCIEDKNIALSEDEYTYVISMIRNKSLPKNIKFDFTCSSCKHEYEYTADLEKVITADYEKYHDIIYKNIIISIGYIQNRIFHDKLMDSLDTLDEKSLFDFILHIKSFNDNEYTFEELNDVINNLNVDEFENIFEQWDKMRFKTNNIYDVKCPKCGAIDTYEFDKLPNFFPDSWNIK